MRWRILRPLGWSAVPRGQPYLLPCKTTHASGEQQTCPRVTTVMSEEGCVCTHTRVCAHTHTHAPPQGDSTLLAVLRKDVLQRDHGWNLLSCRWLAPTPPYHLWTLQSSQKQVDGVVVPVRRWLNLCCANASASIGASALVSNEKNHEMSHSSVGIVSGGFRGIDRGVGVLLRKKQAWWVRLKVSELQVAPSPCVGTRW